MNSVLPVKSYARIEPVLEIPNLIEIQKKSFENLKDEILLDLFTEISPIESYNKGIKLYFPSSTPQVKGFDLKYWFEEPKYSIEECVNAISPMPHPCMCQFS
jgi:DNA-directed RNA polymerase subunit beta